MILILINHAFNLKLSVIRKDCWLCLGGDDKYFISLFELSGKKQTPRDIKEKIDLRLSEEKIAEYLADKEALFNSATEKLEVYLVCVIKKNTHKKYYAY